MNGWWWAALAIAIQAAGAVLMSRALRHGEEQDRATRQTDPHAAYWGCEQPQPDHPLPGPHTPAWARPDHHGRHRR